MNDPQPLDEGAIESLVAEATDDFIACCDRGESPDIEDYARRHPQIAGILRQLLPAMRVVSVEQASCLLPHKRDAYAAEESLGTLGDFRLLRQIGRGGMGVVYLAEQISLGRRVALKVLPLAAALDPRQLQRFRMEAQAAAHLHHSHIVPIYSVGCERGVYYYAMQYIEGRSLAEVIADLAQSRGADRLSPGTTADRPAAEPPLAADSSSSALRAAGETTDEPRAMAATVRSLHGSAHFQTVAALGIQAAEALQHAHCMGVVHRDIKPANLLLDDRGILYVTDFGLARLHGGADLTQTGDLAGTLRYMSPEQTQPEPELVDYRTDIYSLGATLYELLTLNPAFDAPDRPSLLRKVAEDDPVQPRERNRAIPVDLETIVLKAMAKERHRRYATASEMAADLRRFLEHRPIEARRPTVLERTSKWARRHRSLVAAGLAVLVLAAVGFAASTALIAREQWKTKAAYAQLADEQQRTKAAFDAEAQQRARAERNFHQARQIVDFFTEVSEEELADKIELQGLRRMLLVAALEYYRDFTEQDCDDVEMQMQLAASHLRVAAILDEIGSRSEALAALQRALQIQEKLVSSDPSMQELQQGLLSIYARFGALGGGRELHLLSQKSVQEELGFSAQQVRQVGRLWEKRHELARAPHQFSAEQWRAQFEDLAAQATALADLLEPEQDRRLRQIALQQRGTEAFSDPEIVAALALSEEQTASIRAIQDEFRRAMRAGSHPGHPHFRFRPDEWRKVRDSWRQTWDQIFEVLTVDQQARWKELVGEPFRGRTRSPHWSGHAPRGGS